MLQPELSLQEHNLTLVTLIVIRVFNILKIKWLLRRSIASVHSFICTNIWWGLLCYKLSYKLCRLWHGVMLSPRLYLQNVACLGILHRLLDLWIAAGPLFCRLSSHQMEKISRKLIGSRHYIPVDFAHKPTGLWEAEIESHRVASVLVVHRTSDTLQCVVIVANFILASPIGLVNHLEVDWWDFGT